MKPYEGRLHKALHDLLSAKKLIGGNDPIRDTAAYHTQQCAEKSLKAFLAFHNRSIDKTHDLQLLFEFCIDIDPSYAELYEDGLTINPYSTIFRYPGVVVEPEMKDIQEAIEVAEKILNITVSKLGLEKNWHKHLSK